MADVKVTGDNVTLATEKAKELLKAAFDELKNVGKPQTKGAPAYFPNGIGLVSFTFDVFQIVKIEFKVVGVGEKGGGFAFEVTEEHEEQ